MKIRNAVNGEFAIFRTKFAENEEYNGKIVEILAYENYEGRSENENRYIIRFIDNNKILDNIYGTELENI